MVDVRSPTTSLRSPLLCLVAMLGWLCWLSSSSHPHHHALASGRQGGSVVLALSLISENKKNQQHHRHRSTKKKQTTTNNKEKSAKTLLLSQLQRSGTPNELLDGVGKFVTPENDPDGSVSSLVLVRLSKQLMDLDNNNNNNKNAPCINLYHLENVSTCLAQSASRSSVGNTNNNSIHVDNLVEGTKASAVVSRLLFPSGKKTISSSLRPVFDCWHDDGMNHFLVNNDLLQEQHLSGLQWAFATVHHVATTATTAATSTTSGTAAPPCWDDDSGTTFTLPRPLQSAYDDLQLPFVILPAACEFQENDHISQQQSVLEALMDEVEFAVDEIRTTTTGQVVTERRPTAWLGNPHVGPFKYSGKTMPRQPWTPTVQQIRDKVQRVTGQSYDCCLLNLYPHADSAMRYHADPDQGSKWSYDTAVVSVGATRRFSFRSCRGNREHNDNCSNNKAAVHNFVVLHGDVVHMFGNCQAAYQHAVKKDAHHEGKAPRISLVFKRTYNAAADDRRRV